MQKLSINCITSVQCNSETGRNKSKFRSRNRLGKSLIGSMVDLWTFGGLGLDSSVQLSGGIPFETRTERSI